MGYGQPGMMGGMPQPARSNTVSLRKNHPPKKSFSPLSKSRGAPYLVSFVSAADPEANLQEHLEKIDGAQAASLEVVCEKRVPHPLGKSTAVEGIFETYGKDLNSASL